MGRRCDDALAIAFAFELSSAKLTSHLGHGFRGQLCHLIQDATQSGVADFCDASSAGVFSRLRQSQVESCQFLDLLEMVEPIRSQRFGNELRSQVLADVGDGGEDVEAGILFGQPDQGFFHPFDLIFDPLEVFNPTIQDDPQGVFERPGTWVTESSEYMGNTSIGVSSYL